jgi:hypothetical protein
MRGLIENMVLLNQTLGHHFKKFEIFEIVQGNSLETNFHLCLVNLLSSLKEPIVSTRPSILLRRIFPFGKVESNKLIL